MKKSWKWVIVCALCSVGVALFVQPFWYEFGAVMGLTAKGIAWILVVVGVGAWKCASIGSTVPSNPAPPAQVQSQHAQFPSSQQDFDTDVQR